MPILKQIYADDNCLTIWQINEPEDVLAKTLESKVDLPDNPHRRLEKLAVHNLLKHLNYGEAYFYHLDGRPYIPDNNLHLSISHAGDKVVVAVNRNRAVGVDVEQTQRNYRRIAPKYMSQRELDNLEFYSLQEMSLIWCVKEAIFKLPWGCSKVFSEEIEVNVNPEAMGLGWCSVQVKNNGTWQRMRATFEYIDNYCLAWVNL